MRNRLFFSPILLLLLPLAFVQDWCRQQPPPQPQPTPQAEPPHPIPLGGGESTDVRALQARLSVTWEQGPPVSKLKIDYVVENTSAQPVRLSFRNGGRVCGVVLDSQSRQVAVFPEATTQVLGEEAFPPGDARLFRHQVRRNELGERLATSYTVEAWLCGYEKLRQRATVKIAAGK